MKIAISVVLFGACLLAGCSNEKPAMTPAAGQAPPENPANTAAVRPDVTKLRTHLEGHVKYPATRSQILDACANTPEFTAAEKRWIADNLPEGTYNSAGSVEEALRL